MVHAKSIANLCKLSRLCSHWSFRLFLCTPYPNFGELSIIRRGCQWAKYRDLSEGNRLPKWKAEANNWSVLSLIRSPNLFFNEYLRETKRSAIFTQEGSQANLAKHSWTTLHMSRHIICSQIFAGHVVGSRQMKRKKHLHRMNDIINDHALPVQKAV